MLNIFSAFIAVSVLFFLPGIVLSSDVLKTYDFDDMEVFEDRAFTEAASGVHISGRFYGQNKKNIYRGEGAALLIYRSSSKGEGWWGIKAEKLSSGYVRGYSFWVKGVSGKEKFFAGVRDTSGKEASTSVQLTGREWSNIQVSLSKVEVNTKKISQFFIRFKDDSTSSQLFLDDIVFMGKGQMQSAVPVPVAAAVTVPPPAETVPGKNAYTGNPPIQELIRTFNRTDQDLEAVNKMLLAASRNDPQSSAKMSGEEFMDMIMQKLVLFFWYESNPDNGITLDRGRCFKTNDNVIGSNASAGFMLTAMGIGHSRGWLTYEQAYERVLTTLKFHRDKAKNVNGFFYHFVDLDGNREWDCELSTIDTALFLAGIVFSMEYFKGTEIEKVANDLYMRVDWRWTHDPGAPGSSGGKFCSMGWSPDRGWGKGGDSWNRYCEGLLLSILELGHPTANINTNSWFDLGADRGTYKGFHTISKVTPLFCFHYQHCWLDFRDKNDGRMNHFEVSRLKTLANRQFGIDLMNQRNGYGPNSWGFTACDHPDGYWPFGAPPGASGENGTVAPCAPGGSFAFTPYFALKAFRHMYDTWRDKIWGKYAFVDAYHIEKNWFAPDNIGIDQGAILLSMENHRTGMVWKYMMENRYIKEAFRKIGFVDEPRASAKVLPLDLSGEDWLFLQGGGSSKYLKNTQDTHWRKVYVPDKIENQLLKPVDGIFWYRKHFTVSGEDLESWKGKKIYLHIGGIDDEDTTYINGQKIGSTRGWEKTRKYHIKEGIIKADEDNVIAVKVKDSSGDGGIWLHPVEIGPYIERPCRPFK